MSDPQFSRALLKKQLADLSKASDLGFSVGLVDENDYYKWTVFIPGPEDSLYEGGFFKAILTFPEDFPQSPPEMKFVTEMFHPNIYKDGRVCISILHNPGMDQFNEQEKSEEKVHIAVLGCESRNKNANPQTNSQQKQNKQRKQ